MSTLFTALCHCFFCSEKVDENEPESKATGPSEAFLLDHDGTDETEPALKANEKDKTTGDKRANTESSQAQKGEIIFSSSHDMKVTLIPVSDIENIAEKGENEE